MKLIADLQLHSKYSRATSPRMIPEELEYWAKLKGINIIGTGDSSHPGWVKELKLKLEPTQAQGLYKLKSEYSKLEQPWDPKIGPYFLISGEISNVYKHSHQVRKVHTLLLCPNFEILDKINAQLAEKGNIVYDGRPIIGITALELAQIYWNADEWCEVIPAHIWTPWFSIFGSKSGYDNLKQCYDEFENKIHCLETGLSSDLAMNWRISKLDRNTFVSNSDAHSLENLGREATILDLDIEKLSYKNIIIAFREPKKGFVGTIEFYPEEGRYHNDGHRACKINISPEEAKKLKNFCPVCGKPLTLGVLHRVAELADRDENEYKNLNHTVYYAIPLQELIAEVRGLKGKLSNSVQAQYLFYCQKVPELELLLFKSETDLKKILFPELVEAIIKMRRGEVYHVAGYD